MTRHYGIDSRPTPATSLAKEKVTLKILNSLGRLDIFTPAQLVSDTQLTHRANLSTRPRTVAHIIIAVFFLSLFMAPGQAYVYYHFAPTEELKRSVLMLFGFAYVYTFFALLLFKYFHRSTSTLSNSYAGLALTLTLGVHGLTGLSFSSPIVPLYFFLPAWAFLSCSSRAGLWWSVVVACVFIGVSVIAPMQLNLPNIIPETELVSFQLTSAISALMLLGFCLYAHQSSFLALTDELDEDRMLYAHKARHDPLTGLANREMFDLQMQEALDDVNLKNQAAALIYIDLNDFKAVNDTYGHQVGDAVLQVAALRIKKVVRDSDTIARIGGDEFGVVLPNLQDRNTVTRIVTELEESLAQPMHMADITLSISGSAGMAIAPEDGRTASGLTRHADRNMYDAKGKRARLKLVRAS